MWYPLSLNQTVYTTPPAQWKHPLQWHPSIASNSRSCLDTVPRKQEAEGHEWDQWQLRNVSNDSGQLCMHVFSIHACKYMNVTYILVMVWVYYYRCVLITSTCTTYVHIWACKFMYVCMYVHNYVHVYMHVQVHVCMEYASTCMYVHVWACKYMYVCNANTSTIIHNMHARTCMHAQALTCTNRLEGNSVWGHVIKYWC